MKLQVKQWGSSKAIRLPSEFLKSLGMETGDFLELSDLDTEHNRIVFMVKKNTAPTIRKKRLTLDERLANAHDSEFFMSDEWDKLQPVGEELI